MSLEKIIADLKKKAAKQSSISSRAFDNNNWQHGNESSRAEEQKAKSSPDPFKKGPASSVGILFGVTNGKPGRASRYKPCYNCNDDPTCMVCDGDGYIER